VCGGKDNKEDGNLTDENKEMRNTDLIVEYWYKQ
jgi:hypothetical protein